MMRGADPNAQPHVALLGAANSVHLQRWAIALAERGRRISLISQQAHLALPLPPAVDLHALPIASAAGYLLNAWALRRLLSRLAPDLLHVHYASGYGTLGRLSGFRPRLLSVWGSDVYEFPQTSRLHAAWLRANLRAAGALASTSQAMADRVRELWPDAGPIALTPFGVDTDRFAPARRPPAPPRRLTIGTVKTLAPAYGIDLLIEAFARLPGRDDLRLVIVGGGPDEPLLRALAARLGVAAEFAGAIDHAEVPQRLAGLDIYVAPSRIESFGVGVVEAMACGVPVVVSDAGGLPEVVADCGVVVPSGDIAALANALAALAADPARRRALAAAGRARACSAYAWPACVDRMIACQDSAAATARR